MTTKSRAQLIEEIMVILEGDKTTREEVEVAGKDMLAQSGVTDEFINKVFETEPNDQKVNLAKLVSMENRNTLILSDLSLEDLQATLTYYASDAGKRWLAVRKTAQTYGRTHFIDYTRSIGRAAQYVLWIHMHGTITCSILSARPDMPVDEIIKMATGIAKSSMVCRPVDSNHIQEAENVSRKFVETARNIATKTAENFRELLNTIANGRGGTGSNDVDPKKLIERLFGPGQPVADTPKQSSQNPTGKERPKSDVATRDDKPADEDDPLHSWPVPKQPR